ncbi:MAG: PKD domain-containing protein, partial [Bacteroidota bacterium]
WQGNRRTLPDINSPASVYLIGYDVNGCPGDTAFANISLEPTPTANFGVDVVCQGNITTFSDSSLSNVSPIASWNWDFDDNTPIDVNVNPNHTFTNAGSFDVSLVVTAQNGCRDTLTRNVAVRPSPQVDFTFTNVCEGLPNILTDNSTISAGGLITEYYWDFGDNSPQGAGSVVNHTFPGSGYYNVTHTVSSDNGCSNEFTKTVFVHPNPIADFDVISACINGVVLASTSSTVDGSLDFIQTHDWNFGDPGSGANNQSNETNPTHVYGSAQVYTVSLTVTTGNGCSDTEAKPVTVYPDPVADFVVDDRCENQNTQFTNTSTADPQTPIVTYAWDYGNGDNSAGRDGSQFYGNRPGPGVYPVSLTVETDQGCANTEVKNVRIFPAPEPQFVADPVCFGEPTLFENQSNVFTGDIISWSWDFGSNGQVSADSTPSFTYNAPGTYGVSLIARTDSGCENIFSREITVYELPEILEVRDATVCFGDVATLLVTADPSVTINWFYGPTGGAPFHQGFAYTTPPLPVPTTFYVEPQSEEGCINGRREVNVNLFNDEAMEMESSADVVEMPVAIVNFNTVSSIQIVNWSWNFGDDNTSAEASPAHEFQYPGKYRVTVVTEDENGCELTDSKVIEVKKIVNVSLPSAFSPNGDGFNDLFRIGHYKLGTFNIAIFNRWGQKVFESDNPDFTWNGKGPKGDDLQEGVYVYQLMATDFEGKEIKESRTITLVR